MKPALACLLLLCCLAACGWQAPDSAASAPSAAPAVLPASSPTAALHLVPTPAGADGELLSPALQQKLYSVSQAYVADSVDSARALARSMDFAGGNGDTSSMCGPLAISILRDAGLIEKDVSLQDFWLWRPNFNPRLAELTFPAARFEHLTFTQSLDQFDFAASPLKAGDFVYLYAGQAGTFEHMLVVTRVDSAGRAYSVTNLKTPDGFVVREVLLYDPARPGSGQFYTWTDRRNLQLGLTGFGGFEVWRLTAPPPLPSLRQAVLADSLDALLSDSTGSWQVDLRQVDGPVLYSHRGDDPLAAAAALHIPVALLFLKTLETRQIPTGGLDGFLATHGVGRTYAVLLDAMLFRSDESAATTLIEQARSNRLDDRQTLLAWGTDRIDLQAGTLTAGQFARLLAGLDDGSELTPEARAAFLDLVRAGPSAGPSGLEVLRPLLPAGAQLIDFQPAMTNGPRQVGAAAILSLPQAQGTVDYQLVVFGESSGSPEGVPDPQATIAEIARLLWNYVTSFP